MPNFSRICEFSGRYRWLLPSRADPEEGQELLGVASQRDYGWVGGVELDAATPQEKCKECPNCRFCFELGIHEQARHLRIRHLFLAHQFL